jgi:hypothetical protein
MSRKRFYRLALIFVILITVLIIIFYRKSKSFPPDTFFAVFLTNDQVYFGHITKETSKTLTLENVYYLKANAEVNTADPESETNAGTAKVSLIKLGEELHSPEDKMVINKEQIIFWEKMRSAGVVMNAILQDEKNQLPQ